MFEFDQEIEYMSAKQRRVFLENKLNDLQTLHPEWKPVKPLSPRQKLGSTFWGQTWCQHVEFYADLDGRADRGRSYLRQGSVFHLHIEGQTIQAEVYGQELYSVEISFQPLKETELQDIQNLLSEEVGSALDLISGNFSKSLKDLLKQDKGLFPKPEDMQYSCNCLDDADFCKHIAATLYAVGLGFDADAGLLFELRGIEPIDLIKDLLAENNEDKHAASSDELQSLFDIDLI